MGDNRSYGIVVGLVVGTCLTFFSTFRTEQPSDVDELPSIEQNQTALQPAARRGAIVWLHGLGDSPEGISLLRRILFSAGKLGEYEWLCPGAPVQAVTANKGAEMRSWFDIAEFPLHPSSPRSSKESVMETVKLVHQTLDGLIKSGVEPSQILLGGVSQGGALALVSSLSYHVTLAGTVIMWGWNPLEEIILRDSISSEGRKTPFLWSHGKNDTLILKENAIEGSNFLNANEVKCELHLNDHQGHNMIDAENEIVTRWVQEKLIG